ncbi:MAG: hypothetical protein ACRDF4_01310 [Rhabdochlamydiaceae bacterium]
MSNDQIPSMFDQPVQVLVEIEPIEEEAEDVDSLAVTEQTRFDVQQEIGGMKDYQVEAIPAHSEQSATRGVDVLLLITSVGAVLAARQDLIMSVFKTIETVVEVLAKRGRIEEIQIIVDGKTLILRDVSKKMAQELIAAFEARHPGSTTQMPTQSSVQVKASVSKKKKKRA